MTKRALVIGINYEGPNKLNGCVSDAFRVNDMLMNRGFIVLLLTENNTHYNIFQAIRWLLCDCSVDQLKTCSHNKDGISSDMLYYHFSGHGNVIHDKNTTYNSIITEDHKYITNDDIYKNLLCLLPQGVKLRGCVDCCSSRSNFDLKWNITKKDRIYTLQKSSNGRNNYCDAIIISSSSNYNNSYDTVINGIKTGVLTYYYLEYVNKHNKIILSKLLDYLHTKLSHYYQTPGISMGKQMSLTTDLWY